MTGCEDHLARASGLVGLPVPPLGKRLGPGHAPGGMISLCSRKLRSAKLVSALACTALYEYFTHSSNCPASMVF